VNDELKLNYKKMGILFIISTLSVGIFAYGNDPSTAHGTLWPLRYTGNSIDGFQVANPQNIWRFDTYLGTIDLLDSKEIIEIRFWADHDTDEVSVLKWVKIGTEVQLVLDPQHEWPEELDTRVSVELDDSTIVWFRSPGFAWRRRP
jgi:hypothetical protein